MPNHTKSSIRSNSMDVGLKGYAHDFGIGGRLVVNKSMVVSADYAISREDKTFNMNANHPF